MNSEHNRYAVRQKSRWIAGFILAVIVAIGIVQWRATPYLLQFRFNGFALLTLLSIIANIVVLIKVSRIRGRVEGMRWFVLFACSAMIYGISEFFLRLSSMPEAAIYWTTISSIGITLIPLSIYFFVAEYIGQQNRQPMLFSLFIISAGIFNYIGGNGNILYNLNPAQAILYPWGYNNAVGPGYGIYILWIGVLSGVALYRLYRFRKSSTQEIIRRQSLIFMFAIGVPIVVGIVNDGILPLLGYLTLPLAVVAQTGASILIAYGIHKYRLFEIDPQRLASNVLLTMNEAVIITRPDYTIEQLNPKAEQLLQVNPGEVAGINFSNFFGQHAWSNVLSTVQPTTATAPRLGNLQLIGSRGRETPVRVVATVLRETDDITVFIFVVMHVRFIYLVK